MAVLAAKGTLLKQDLASVFTTVAQVLSLGWDGMEAGAFEIKTLDGDAAMERMATGDTDFGTVTAELYLDPALAGHKALITLLTTPSDENWKVVFSDGSHTEWAFTSAGAGLSMTAQLGDGVKGTLKLPVDGLPTFP